MSSSSTTRPRASSAAGPDCPLRGDACRGLTHPRYCTLAGCGRPGPGAEPDPATRAYYREWLERGEATYRTPRPDPAAGLERREAMERPASVGPEILRRDRNTKVRAVMVTPSLGIGGAERWMADAIRRTGAAVSWRAVAALHREAIAPEMAAELGELAPIAAGWGRLREATEGAELAIVWGLDLAELVTAAAPGVRWLAVSHGVGEWTARAMRSAGLAAGLAAVSSAALRPIPAAERHRVRVIPNAVDPARMFSRASREATRAAWGLEPDQKALAMIGRLSDEKNPGAIAAAVAELHRRGHTEWRGVHIGSGWQAAKYRELAEATAPGLVRFPGPTADVAGALAAADAVALPSHEEACSIALAESLWCGRPTIAARVGTVEQPEIAAVVRAVSPGCSGAELADAILADQADPRGTAARAVAGRDLARELYRPERFAREWIAAIWDAARPGIAPPGCGCESGAA